jgi:3'(2'), 5'-bisphosphate nucleotidase
MSEGMFALEKRCAQLAVKRACQLTQSVSRGGSESITKSDSSPVTVGDFGAQALIINALLRAFPHDKVVGEENADKLRTDEGLRSQVFSEIERTNQATEQVTSQIGKIHNETEMLDAIDQGNFEGGSKGRIWALDPIDGTKGFLRREQYAVCLALMVNSEVVLGVIGCPNLNGGSLFTAVKGQGATCQPLTGSIGVEERDISFRNVSSPNEAVFCESVESGHSSHSANARIAEKLGITAPSVRMDSQAKYCSVAMGQADIYLRLPVNDLYQEKIWDHAAGNILVSEAGGQVSDINGQPLNFGIGRTLAENKGVIASGKSIHQQVLNAVKETLQEQKK